MTSSTFTEMPAFDRNSIEQGSEDPSRDLGFGSEVARGSHKRLLNRDGTFNVTRFGLAPFSSLSIYHWSLSTSWPRFLGMLAVAYLSINTLFAIGYILCGINGLQGEFVTSQVDIFLRAFFFSVQTFATIGYGHVIAVGTGANLLVTTEAFLNIVGVALSTGVVFARFSRPTAKIIYSHNAVVAPYRGIRALEFRIANARSSQIIELEAKVILSRIEASADGLVRKFRDLRLERTSVTFFPLSWTLVHPIDEHSPLSGMNHEDLLESNAELLILLSGTDETSSQTVHSRSSYKADEIVWNAAFAPIFKRGRDDGILGMDVGMIHEYVKTGLGTETVQVLARKASN